MPAGALVAVALVVGSLGLSGCAIISKVRKVVHTVEGNKATMDAFTNKIQSGPTTFEATYVTTGKSPATIVYAVQPPAGLLFTLTQTPTGTTTTTIAGGANFDGNLDVIVNKTGEYSCSPPAAGSSSKATQCTKLPPTSAADYNNILDFYTPTHWVNFLKGFALAAGFAGDKVTDSSMTVNGFPMSCVDFTPPGEGTSTICTTAQNILGYVKVTGDATSFEITKYSTTPSASLFQVPAGATITTIPPQTTTTTTS
jgi:outer membrane murein-binding lipoprotein Lpp